MITEFVKVKDSEYDCAHCGAVHRYSDGTIYQLHQDLASTARRWIIEVIE
jgi:hypothetical protein